MKQSVALRTILFLVAALLSSVAWSISAELLEKGMKIQKAAEPKAEAPKKVVPNKKAPIKKATVSTPSENVPVKSSSDPKPGKVFKDCSDCPLMVVVPAGRFTMGSPSYEGGRSDHEGPEHLVTIDQPFAVGKFAVTVGEFARFVSETGYSEYSKESADCLSYAKQDDINYPVVCVSWDDAKAYVSWLSRKTNQRYRLLSEAEYEYADRAGSASRYSWGGEASDACTYANVFDIGMIKVNENVVVKFLHHCNDGYPESSPVGRFKANSFGLHDMTGNTLSWVEDCSTGNYTGAPVDGSAWLAGPCDLRRIRGSYYYSSPDQARSASRMGSESTKRLFILGFRVAKTL